MRAYSGVKIEDLTIGSGPVAEAGMTVTIRYDGHLNGGDAFQQGMLCSFRLRGRQVIAGLEYGILGMRVGGRRRIRVSPHLAYGETGVAGVIPPSAVLIFEVELLAAERANNPSDHYCADGDWPPGGTSLRPFE